jgi:Delta6-protoilludene synthase
MEITTPESQRRFITTFAEYVYAVSDEASDRATGRVRGVEDYLKLTRLTTAGYPSFFPAEAGLTIPDEVMAHPVLQAILCFSAESLVLTNVGLSCNLWLSQHTSLTAMARTCTRTTSSKRLDMAAITLSLSS